MNNINLFLAVNEILETRRLKLRPVTLADAEDMYEYASDDENTYYVFPTHQNLDDTRHSIANFFAANPLGKFGIELKEEQKLIGTIDLRVDTKKRSGELGYMLNHNYQRQGFTTEAAFALLELGFEQLELEKIQAQCDTRNIASAKVMEKLGMQQEGISRHHELWKKGEWVDMAYYGILKDEYFANKRSSN